MSKEKESKISKYKSTQRECMYTYTNIFGWARARTFAYSLIVCPSFYFIAANDAATVAAVVSYQFWNLIEWNDLLCVIVPFYIYLNSFSTYTHIHYLENSRNRICFDCKHIHTRCSLYVIHTKGESIQVQIWHHNKINIFNRTTARVYSCLYSQHFYNSEIQRKHTHKQSYRARAHTLKYTVNCARKKKRNE